MKHKKVVALLLSGALICGGAALAADAGSASDPLISLSWLKGTFLPDALAQAESRAEAGMDALESGLNTMSDLRVKCGDVIKMQSGATLTHLAGELTLSVSGAVVDVTEGQEVSDTLLTGHRYLTAEKTKADFTVASDTAVVRLTGPYELTKSDEVDYNAMADTLKALGLFKGTDTPYGSGYDLEKAPTRVQGLVLFLRLLGEEESALNYPGNPAYFTDVPEWALPYVTYAYDMGYTKGQEITADWRVVFGTDSPIGAGDYVTFLLRALGYKEGSDFRWETALTDAQTLGVLTAGEVEMLSQKPFLRAQTVYLSYFALSAKTAGEEGISLLERLDQRGIIDVSTQVDTMKDLNLQRL